MGEGMQEYNTVRMLALGEVVACVSDCFGALLLQADAFDEAFSAPATGNV